MKRTILYSVILVALGVLVYFTLLKDRLGSYSKKDTAFAVKDSTVIGEIVLSNLKGDSINLKSNGGSWLLNNRYPARPDAVSNLLRTMTQIEVKVPVAKSMHNNVIKDISGRRTKVEVYNAKHEKIKSYYIGDNTDELNGNFMLMEGSKHVFVMNIPGFDGFVSTVYFMDETEWRSREIFRFDPNEIMQIDVTYAGQKDSSFSIVRTAGNTLQLVSGKTTTAVPNPEIMQYYLKQYKLLNCESFITDTYKKDSLAALPAVCEIMVTDKSKRSQLLKVYYRPVTYRSKVQFTYEDKPIEFDLDKFYGVYNNNGDLAIIQNFVFGKLFVGPDYFYRQRPTGGNTLTEGILNK